MTKNTRRTNGHQIRRIFHHALLYRTVFIERVSVKSWTPDHSVDAQQNTGDVKKISTCYDTSPGLQMRVQKSEALAVSNM